MKSLANTRFLVWGTSALRRALCPSVIVPSGSRPHQLLAVLAAPEPPNTSAPHFWTRKQAETCPRSLEQQHLDSSPVSPPSPFCRWAGQSCFPAPSTRTFLSPSETHHSEQPAGSRLSPARALGPTGGPGNEAATDLGFPPLGKDGGLERAGLRGSVLSHKSRETWGGASQSIKPEFPGLQTGTPMSTHRAAVGTPNTQRCTTPRKQGGRAEGRAGWSGTPCSLPEPHRAGGEASSSASPGHSPGRVPRLGQQAL